MSNCFGACDLEDRSALCGPLVGSVRVSLWKTHGQTKHGSHFKQRSLDRTLYRNWSPRRKAFGFRDKVVKGSRQNRPVSSVRRLALCLRRLCGVCLRAQRVCFGLTCVASLSGQAAPRDHFNVWHCACVSMDCRTDTTKGNLTV